MAHTAENPFPTWNSASELRRSWPAFVALGIALTILGMIASVNLFMATVAATYYLGAMMLVGGVFQLAHAFSVRKWGRVALWTLSGVLYLLAGLSVFSDPLFAATLLTLFLVISLGLSGLVRLWAAVGAKVDGRGWVLASGIFSITAAAVIGVGWPVNSIWLLGLILSIDLMFQGISLIFAGFAFRNTRSG